MTELEYATVLLAQGNCLRLECGQYNENDERIPACPCYDIDECQTGTPFYNLTEASISRCQSIVCGRHGIRTTTENRKKALDVIFGK